jgi:hypothetical protein
VGTAAGTKVSSGRDDRRYRGRRPRGRLEVATEEVFDVVEENWH